MVSINVKTENSATIVELSGEVDLYSSPEMRKHLLKLVQDKTPVIVIDLEKVSYIDSSGVATLVEGLQEAGKYSGTLKLTNLHDTVRHVFELSSLDKVFDIYNSLDEAIKS
jgi:anti-sigma B factor antagonist